MSPTGRDWKRCVDVVIALLLLILFSPILLVSGFAVWLFEGTPVVFRQQRVGRHGSRFHILKLRTMREKAGAAVTVAGDPRITSVGRVLRSLKLDELPQLWNVVRGDMSMVGPRPEVAKYIDVYPHAFTAIASLRPGVTGWSSVAFQDESDILQAHATDQHFYEDVILPRKLALDRLYHRHRSLWVDIATILATACLLLRVAWLSRVFVDHRLLAEARRGLEP